MPDMQESAFRVPLRKSLIAVAAGSLGLATGIALGMKAGPVVKLLAQGESKRLREKTPGRSPRNGLLIVALDGVGRDLLYGMLADGELPGLESLLGGGSRTLAHAHLVPDMTSILPSTTIAAWASLFTGEPPARNGVTGNEFFIRERKQFAAPIPTTFESIWPVLATYTEGYANRFLEVPTIYERLREEVPGARIWVSMSQYYEGADRLLLTDRSVLTEAWSAFLSHTFDNDKQSFYELLDDQALENVIDDLQDCDLPDILTLYLVGTDLYAHVAHIGPDEARRHYLREVIDPRLAELARLLRKRHALDDRYVVVTADHGHTEVVHDEEHALSVTEDDDPPAVLRAAGYRLRPFGLDDEGETFDAVLAYQGAMAYVYLADRSDADQPAWSKPPRYEEDVLPAADAFFRSSQEGEPIAAMRGTLDLVLTRRPRPVEEDALPFEVYTGGGKTIPIGEWLRNNPRETYLDLESRLHDLAAGPYGHRAGDILLLANNGNRERPEDRYYFAFRYRSWHGSPSEKDSCVPFILAHARRSEAELRALAEETLGTRPTLDKAWPLFRRLVVTQGAVAGVHAGRQH